MFKDATIDIYTYYDYKISFKGNSPHPVPSWVPEDERRRLRAYSLLDSYLKNSARTYLSNIDENDRMSRREYGDPETIRDQILSSLLGDTQTISVENSIGADFDQRAAECLEKLKEWSENENLIVKLMDCERKTIGLGDGVYVLGLPEGKTRPRLRVFDPAFYYPVLDPEDDDDFPKKIHIAWEFEKLNARREKQTFLRRLTWEIVDLEELDELPRGSDLYPWLEGGETSDKTVLYSDGVWNITDMKGTIPDLDPARAEWKSLEVDLYIDFIPVIHNINLGDGEGGFGISFMARIIQIFDDLMAADTDLSASAATTGSPPIAVSGANLPKDENGKISTYGPGTVWETGDGTATMIDTSTNLDAMLKFDKYLLERLSVNGRIPESLLGRVKPNEVPSGVALTLSFTPHAGMIKEMRLLRNPKYRLLFKFVMRFMMQTGELEPGPTPNAHLDFGTFLPADKQETSTLVTQLIRKDRPIISLETAVRMLTQAGLPIEDAWKEVNRVRTEDFHGANALLEATGDPNAVRRMLALDGQPPNTEDMFEDGTVFLSEEDDTDL